jgi:hypothetical protein
VVCLHNSADWHVLKLKKSKRIIAENKLKTKFPRWKILIEIIQEREKDFNNAMGQESLTRLTNLKRKKPSKKTRPVGENVIIANNKKPANNNSSFETE